MSTLKIDIAHIIDQDALINLGNGKCDRPGGKDVHLRHLPDHSRGPKDPPLGRTSDASLDKGGKIRSFKSVDNFFELTLISQDLLGRCNIHELFLSLLLVLLLLELVRMPLHRQLLVGLQSSWLIDLINFWISDL